MAEKSVESPAPSLKWASASKGTVRETTPPAWLGVGLHSKSVTKKSGDSENILFVCTGNICRSAFASAYLGYLLKDSRVVVESAGTEALVGHAMDQRALLIADHLGVDGSAHRARQLTGRMLSTASLVVVFGPEHYKWIQENNPEAIVKTMAIRQFANSSEQIVSDPRGFSLFDLLSAVKRTKPALDGSSWIRDPYKKDDLEYMQIMGEVTQTLEGLRGRIQW